jgi:hypothetical protein
MMRLRNAAFNYLSILRLSLNNILIFRAQPEGPEAVVSIVVHKQLPPTLAQDSQFKPTISRLCLTYFQPLF